MTYRHNLKIIAFVGLSGSGKSTVIDYLNEKGYPKVSREEIVSQIQHLSDSGQHRVITEELVDIDLYHTMKHEFPGELHVVAITTNVRTRHHRLSARLENPLNEPQATTEDQEEAEHGAELVALADYFVTNDGSRDDLFAQIDELIEKLDFTL